MQIQGITLFTEEQELEIRRTIVASLKTAAAFGRMDQKWFEEGLALLRELGALHVLRHMVQNHQPEVHPAENGATLVYVCDKDDHSRTEPGGTA